MLNWKVRFKNPTFVVTVAIPGAIILVQMIMAFINEFVAPIGFTITEDAVNGALAIVNFFALTFLGIGGAIDPTTEGVSDSPQAQNYTEPK